MMITIFVRKNEVTDELIHPKPSKQTFYQKFINIVTMPFHSDDLDKLDDSSHEFIPIKPSSKSSDMVIYDNPLYDELPPIQSKN